MKLTKEEREIMDSVERGEWKRVSNFEEEKSRLEAAAATTLRQDKRVNIKLTERDLVHFQRKAAEEGLPYQAYISSVLHKYINGNLQGQTK